MQQDPPARTLLLSAEGNNMHKMFTFFALSMVSVNDIYCLATNQLEFQLNNDWHSDLSASCKTGKFRASNFSRSATLPTHSRVVAFAHSKYLTCSATICTRCGWHVFTTSKSDLLSIIIVLKSWHKVRLHDHYGAGGRGKQNKY